MNNEIINNIKNNFEIDKVMSDKELNDRIIEDQIIAQRNKEALGAAWANTSEVVTLSSDGTYISINDNGAGSPVIAFNPTTAFLYVSAAAVGNVTLGNPITTIDGYTMQPGNKFLLWQQTSFSQNGVYTWTNSTTYTILPYQPNFVFTSQNNGTVYPGALFYNVFPGNSTAYTWSLIQNGKQKSVLQGYVGTVTSYNANVGVGDHIIFDTTLFNRNSDITLTTTGTYTKNPGSLCPGRISLPAGKTFRLTGSLNNVTTSTYGTFAWWNVTNTTGTLIGYPVCGPGTYGNRASSGVNVQYITTTVQTYVELQITSYAISSVEGFTNPFDTAGPAWFTIEEI